MSTLRFTKSLQRFFGIAGVAGVSTLLGLPALAQINTNPIDSTPSVCLPTDNQVAPSQGPTGGATMEQMQANNQQSMNQSNIGTSTYYGQSLPEGNRVSVSGQVSASPAGGSTADYMQGSSGNQQINYLSRAGVDNRQAYQTRSSQVTPTFGPAGGYTMERFRAMSGDRSVLSETRNNQAMSGSSSLDNRGYNYNNQSANNPIAPTAGPAGGYSAGMMGSNNQWSSNTGSLNRVTPSTSASGMSSMNQSMTTGPMPGSMSSDRNRPSSELSPEAGASVSQAIGGC